MKSYLLIESQGEHEAAGVAQFLELAEALGRKGDRVEVMLVQNGVIAARKGAKADALERLIRAGVTVCADEFSLRERALPEKSLKKGVKPAPIGQIIDRMAEGWNVIWH